MSGSRRSAYDDLVQHWKHCLRCPLAEKRLEFDEKAGIYPASVPLVTDGADRGKKEQPPAPSVLHVLYPAPDPEQFRTGNVGGMEPADEETISRSHGLVECAWDVLAEDLPFSIDAVTFSFALGCRPVDFSNPRKITAPNSSQMKACRRRWQVEISLCDPVLVLLCGRHALASVRSDLTKAGDYYQHIGEVVPFYVPGRLPVRHDRDPRVQYVGYVMPSPEDLDLICRDDQIDEPWDGHPVRAESVQPWHHFLWHLTVSCWLAYTVRQLRIGRPIDHDWSLWPYLVRTFQEHFEQKSTSMEELIGRVRDEIEAELSGEGARYYQTLAPIEEARVSLEDDEDDEDEEGEEDDG